MSPVNHKGKAYWRSLDDLAETPEFLEIVRNEFPSFADDLASPQSRRRFLKLMGASTAFAGLAACRWPVEEIVPFAHRPEGFVPGSTTRYATSVERAGVATGLLVTSYDGRPIKIEGNPGHPYSLGAASALDQACILDLYDPDRTRRVTRFDDGEKSVTGWKEFASFAGPLFDDLAERGGRGLAVLAGANSSPSLAAMRRQLAARFPGMKWHEYEPAAAEGARDGGRLAFGRPYRVHPKLDEARVIVCLDEDLFLSHPAAVRFARDFARGRSVDERRVNRLHVVESAFTPTGSMADHRVAVPAATVPAIVARIAAELFLRMGLALPAGFKELRPVLERIPADPAHDGALGPIVKDLMHHRGSSVIVAGPRQGSEVHALVHLLNETLGNTGRTVSYTLEPDPDRPSSVESLRSLVADMQSGVVDTLVILGGNPVFDAPVDLEFERHLGGVGTRIHHGLYENETAVACDWHLPQSHDLESWGDARAWDGTVSITQPLIEPLWGGKSAIEVAASMLGDRATGYDIVRRTFGETTGAADLEARWRRGLHDGLVDGTTWATETPQVRPGPWLREIASRVADPAPAEGIEITFRPDTKILDGRNANNAWLQELPDSLTKVTWDNPALVGPSTADSLGVATGDLIRLRNGDREITVPVLVQPGQAAGSIALALGFGRRAGGRVCEGVGFDVYPLRTTEAMHAFRGTVEPAGGTYPLALTQDHHAIDDRGAAEREKRSHALIREVDATEYLEDPEHAMHHHGHEPVHLWKQHDYEGNAWAMSIDLNACVGCNACVVACQAENNTPVVGKEEIGRGHEMHWIRIDRYFSGDPDSPSAVHQPVMCHHCENAPCEQVCPVAATVHDRDGLNVMVYNRCIGTRYCSNNCPYKVRRFNWFNFNKDVSDLEAMGNNPEVTVRARGVMEKCTFCVQRINDVKIRAGNDQRSIRDGEITPACAQSCPTQAIVFGDQNDENSRVAGLRENPRTYTILDEIYTKPRLRYQARVRNRPDGTGAHNDESHES